MKKKEKENISPEDSELKRKKFKRIRIGILLALMLPLNIFIAANNWYPNETLYIIISIISSLCFIFSFVVIGTALDGSLDGKNSVMILGKRIDNETIKYAKEMTLLEKIKVFNVLGIILSFLAVPIFFGIIYLIFADPAHLFDTFENPARMQLFSLIPLIALGNGLYLKFNRISMSRIQIIIYCASYIIMALVMYSITVPFDNNKLTLSTTEFKNTMNNYGYSVSEVFGIENLKIHNSTVLLAKKDDMMIYYIVSDSRKETVNTFDDFYENYLNRCLSGDKSFRSGYYVEFECKNPNYVKIAYRIKNTMVYSESKIESKQLVKDIFNKIGYSE